MSCRCGEVDEIPVLVMLVLGCDDWAGAVAVGEIYSAFVIGLYLCGLEVETHGQFIDDFDSAPRYDSLAHLSHRNIFSAVDRTPIVERSTHQLNAYVVPTHNLADQQMVVCLVVGFDGSYFPDQSAVIHVYYP